MVICCYTHTFVHWFSSLELQAVYHTWLFIICCWAVKPKQTNKQLNMFSGARLVCRTVGSKGFVSQTTSTFLQRLGWNSVYGITTECRRAWHIMLMFIGLGVDELCAYLVFLKVWTLTLMGHVTLCHEVYPHFFWVKSYLKFGNVRDTISLTSAQALASQPRSYHNLDQDNAPKATIC